MPMSEGRIVVGDLIVTMILFDGGWFMYHYTTCWYVALRCNIAIVVVVVVIIFIVVIIFVEATCDGECVRFSVCG